MEMKEFRERVAHMQEEMEPPERIMEFVRSQDPVLVRDWVAGKGAAAVAADLLKYAEPGYLDHAGFLLDLGVQINEREAWQGWFNIARRLVDNWERGQTPEPEDEGAERALFDLLSRRGVGRSSSIGNHWSPAHQVVSIFNPRPDMLIDRLAQLRERGYGMDAHDEINETPLLVASRNHQLEAAQWLLMDGADPMKRTRGGNGLIQYLLLGSEIGQDDGWRRARGILEACHQAGHDINLLFDGAKDVPQSLEEFRRALVEGFILESNVPPAPSSSRTRRI